MRGSSHSWLQALSLTQQEDRRTSPSLLWWEHTTWTNHELCKHGKQAHAAPPWLRLHFLNVVQIKAFQLFDFKSLLTWSTTTATDVSPGIDWVQIGKHCMFVYHPAQEACSLQYYFLILWRILGVLPPSKAYMEQLKTGCSDPSESDILHTLRWSSRLRASTYVHWIKVCWHLKALQNAN